MFIDYDAMMIGENGGVAHQNVDDYHAYDDFYTDFLILVERMERGEVDGVAVDQFTFTYVVWWMVATDIDRLPVQEMWVQSLG